MYEVEAKFATPDTRLLEQALSARGVRFGPQVVQQDTYYAHPQRNFAETDEALRIRRLGDEARITYKGPKIDSSTKTRREVEIPLYDPQRHGEILTLLGFAEVATVRKTRRTAELEFAGRTFEICLDDVEQVGAYVELETCAPQEQLDAARDALLRLAAELQLTASERRSYLELLLAGQG